MCPRSCALCTLQGCLRDIVNISQSSIMFFCNAWFHVCSRVQFHTLWNTRRCTKLFCWAMCQKYMVWSIHQQVILLCARCHHSCYQCIMHAIRGFNKSIEYHFVHDFINNFSYILSSVLLAIFSVPSCLLNLSLSLSTLLCFFSLSIYFAVSLYHSRIDTSLPYSFFQKLQPFEKKKKIKPSTWKVQQHHSHHIQSRHMRTPMESALDRNLRNLCKTHPHARCAHTTWIKIMSFDYVAHAEKSIFTAYNPVAILAVRYVASIPKHPTFTPRSLVLCQLLTVVLLFCTV